MTTPDWLEAQEELVRLEQRMAELEEHTEKHERREFESCEACDTEFYLVRGQLERHMERWASTWAEEAAALWYVVLEIDEVAKDQAAPWECRLGKIRRYAAEALEER